jgi:hypothetical protein
MLKKFIFICSILLIVVFMSGCLKTSNNTGVNVDNTPSYHEEVDIIEPEESEDAQEMFATARTSGTYTISAWPIVAYTSRGGHYMNHGTVVPTSSLPKSGRNPYWKYTAPVGKTVFFRITANPGKLLAGYELNGRRTRINPPVRSRLVAFSSRTRTNQMLLPYFVNAN